MEKVLACPLDRVNCRVDICISLRGFRNFARGGRGTPLYKPYRYVPPYRVGFLRRSGLKTGIHFAHFGLESNMVVEETTVCMNVFIVSITSE